MTKEGARELVQSRGTYFQTRVKYGSAVCHVAGVSSQLTQAHTTIQTGSRPGAETK